MNKKVFSFGIISTSTLILLENEFPKPDHYSEIRKIYKMTGGEAANSSIVLSTLGIHVKLDGSWIGNNREELNTLEILKQYNIDISRITVKDNYSGLNEVVITDNSTRTIFGNYGSLYNQTSKWNNACKEDIINSDIVCLDPFFGAESKKVAEICVENKKNYVTVDCDFDDYIAQNAEVVIISGEFRGHRYKEISKEDLFEKYSSTCKGLVIFTSGNEDIIYIRENGKVNYIKPYKVDVVDTAGAGDSFRSGIIYGLLNNWSDQKTIQFAAALSGLVCNSFPGVLNSPSLSTIEEFINNHESKIV